jgi:uncharacterized membrane protein YccF (DUF307 family)
MCGGLVLPLGVVHIFLIFPAPLLLAQWQCHSLHLVPIDHGKAIVANPANVASKN